MMGRLKLMTLLFLLGTTHLLVGQESKGDKLAKKHLYLDAIEAYEKAIKSNPTGNLYEKVGNIYLTLKEYEKAKNAFEKTLDFDNIPPKKYMQYGQVLMNVDQLETAIKMFEKYDEEMVGDPRSELYIMSCNQILEWRKEAPGWEVETLTGINTENSEFCPHPYQNGLIYVTNGTPDLVNYGEYEALHDNFYDIYYARRNGKRDFREGELLSPKLMSNYHDGPVAITPDSSAIYFCQVNRGAKGETMNLFYSEIINGEIQSPKPFDYNNNEYSIMHPTFSEDGKMLFFASDNPASFGGYDIFFCKKTRKYGWSAPRPIPGLINTSGNELFPHYHDGRLYFASDGHFGYGGLDIFSASQNEQFKVITNLRAPINSPKDDFSMFFKNEKTGYFASNRDGGMGKDDIYFFKQLEKIEEDENPTMTGTFEYKKLSKSNVELVLYDEEGNEIARTKTDEFGNFEFRNLPTDKNYSIKAIGEFEDADIYITNANGEKLILMTSKNGEFAFRPLSSKDTELMLPVEEEYPTFLTIPMNGFVYRKLKGDLDGRLEVLIYDESGHLLARTYTEQDGSFEFKHLVPDAQYKIVVGTEEDVFIIFNSDDEDMNSPEKIGAAEFIFRRLNGDDETFKLVNEENVILELRQKEKFTLPSIYYETNSYAINAASAEQLDKLYILLKKNPQIKVIFESHTDSRGRDSYNLSLSEKRSEAAVKYLIKKGIAKSMLEAIGYGETKLLNDCGNESNCSDEEHAMNRRTEITIIGKKLNF